jgi:DNA-binding winged helix-turn-helix (wHTH) protein/tetratricopeptide (TPR) repeat protein
MARRFAIGPWILDAESNTVSRDGRVIRLEPKVAEVAACLADRAGEVVRKEDLIRAVWPDTFVTEDVLTKAISELRRALDDDVKRPQYIETIPKRGYKLIAPDVNKLGKTPNISEPQVERKDVNGGGLIEVSVVSSLPPTTIQPTSAVVAENPAAAWLQVKPAKQTLPSRGRVFRVTAILIIGLLGGTWWFFPSHKYALTDKDTIIIADFTNKTGDAIFDDTLKQALATVLGQSPFFNILPDSKVSHTLRLMERSPDEHINLDTAREICQRTGSTVVLAGSIASLGTQYLIDLKAMNCSSGETLTSEEGQASRKEEVLSALGKAAKSLRQRLGESRASIQKFDTPLEVQTSSLEALKAYSQVARTGGAIPYRLLLERAIELDPNFAAAYAGLSDAYAGAGDPELAAQYAQKAYDLRDHATEEERLGITATYYSAVLGDSEKELSVYPVWEQIYPRTWGAWNNSASARISVGDYARALQEAQEALRLNPDMNTPYVNCGMALLALNRLEEVKQIGKQAQAHRVDVSDVHILLYEVAFLENDTREMAAQIEPLLAKPGEGSFDGLWAQSDSEAYFGRRGNSLRNLEKGFSVVRAGHAELAAEVQDTMALRESEFGNRVKARNIALKTSLISSGRGAKLLTALALARAGDATGAAKLADELDRKFPYNTFLHKYWLPTIRASIELVRKNPERAIDILQATSYELGDSGTLAGNMYPVYVRGQAYLEARQGKEAAAEFQKFVDYRSIVSISPLRALARLGLARAYSLEGDRAKARGAYQEFLTLWKDADPDVPILKQAKAEYAELQ